MSVISKSNYSLTPLGAGAVLLGRWDNVLPYASAIITVSTDRDGTLSLYTGMTTTSPLITNYPVIGNTPLVLELPLNYPYLKANLINTSANGQTFLNFEIIYREAVIQTPQVVGITGAVGITGGVSQIGVWNVGITGPVNSWISDADGVAIKLGQKPMSESLPVTIASNQSLIGITGTVALEVGTIPHLNYSADSVLDAGVYKPTDDGVFTHFEITVNAVNNASIYYADETKGVDVSGGWEFTSVLAPSGTMNTKINWYMYQPTIDVVITDLTNNPTNSYYAVVDNVGVEFPMIYIYTKPTVPPTKTTGGTAGSSWYQSKFVYQATEAGKVGTYLLYVGANPTIRPDITHIRLSQLDILCLGTLQPNEIVMSASLQTSSNLGSPAGNFSFTMSKFGAVIAPINTSLQVDANGALRVDGRVKIDGLLYTGGQVSTPSVSGVISMMASTSFYPVAVSENTINPLSGDLRGNLRVAVSTLPNTTGLLFDNADLTVRKYFEVVGSCWSLWGKVNSGSGVGNIKIYTGATQAGSFYDTGIYIPYDASSVDVDIYTQNFTGAPYIGVQGDTSATGTIWYGSRTA